MVEPRVGGQSLFENSMRGLSGSLGFLAGFAIFAGSITVIGLDLFLGPMFLYAQAGTREVALDWWGYAIPWIFSFATSGLLYALWQKTEGKRQQSIMLLAWVIAIMDTLTDIGGFNSLLYGDASAGAMIFPPAGSPGIDWFFNIVVGLACLFHEPLLIMLLGRYQHKVNKADGHDLGDKFEAGFVYLAGFVLSFVKTVTVVIGAWAMVVLDVVLTPQMVDDGAMKWLVLGITCLASAIAIMVWRWYVNVGKEKLKSKQLSIGGKLMLFTAVFYTLIDSYFDMSGYNNMLYGTTELVPNLPTVAWLLTYLMVLIMCTVNEPLNSEIFRPLGKLKQAGGGGGRGGF